MSESYTPLSVNIITKDQPKPTIRAIKSLKPLLRPYDEIIVVDTGSSPANLKKLKKGVRAGVAKEVGIRIIERPDLSVDLEPYIEKWLPERLGELQKDKQYKGCKGILDFAEARNVALKASTNPLVFWIDSDDVLVDEGGNLREAIERSVGGDDPKYGALFLDYLYSFNEDGSLNTTLRRERILRREHYYWKGACHETLIPHEGSADKPVTYFHGMPVAIRHTDDRKKHNISDIRNYIILRNDIDESDYKDPRTYLYLANACRGLERFTEAVKLYKLFERMSGSFEDRFAACLYIASIYMHAEIQRPVDASDWYDKACDIKPRDPRGYFGKSRTFFARYMYRECIDWYEIGQKFPEPTESLHSYDPNSVNFQPHLIASEAAAELKDYENAIKYAQKAVAFRPEFDQAKEQLERVHNHQGSYALYDAIARVAAHNRLGKQCAPQSVRKMHEDLPMAPRECEEAGIGKLETTDPRKPAPRLVIYCGHTPEAWGPESAKTGIGGSEKMVILIAPELQKLGYNVTVYANVPYPQRGVYPDGVRWQHFSEMDKDVPVDTFIAWRNQSYALMNVPAEKRVIWLHDVQNPAAYTPEILAAVDLVICESNYHAEPVREILGDKLVVLNNAILPPKDLDVTKSDPKKIVFMSSPDRGLTTALKIFQLAKQKDPELEFTILYGFSPYERKARVHHTHRSNPDLGRDASVDDYERYVGRLIDETGATMLNRVSFDRVWKELEGAGIWLYPTRFPEISCMSAMEAAAAGCVAVTSEYAALSETILPNSLKINLGPVPADDEQYIKDAAKAVLVAAAIPAYHAGRAASSKAAIEAYGVEALAKNWAAAIKRL